MRYHGAEPGYELTYADVFLMPARSEVRSRLEVSIAGDGAVPLSVPIVSANMTSVTGARLAASLARRGGLGVLPQDLAPQEADQQIRWVKQQPAALDSAVVLGPEQSVAAALARIVAVRGSGVVVCDADDATELLGIVTGERLAAAYPDARLGDLLESSVSLDAEALADTAAVFETLVAAGVHFAPVLDHGRLLGTLSRKRLLRSSLDAANVDAEGRLRVAAAIGINGEVSARARALVEAGVDAVVVDTAHGQLQAMLRTVEQVAALDLGVPVIAGNVATAEGVRDLVSAGASVVKVGVGPGAMCTTRMVTGVGRPQFSAVLECSAQAAMAGVQVWADGGVRHPRDLALAMAAGASAVMVGSWFAGTVESPGDIAYDAEGRAYKESWGMASSRAVTERYRRLSAFEQARRALFSEGISDSKQWIDPVSPSVDELVDALTSGLRSAMSYSGARTLEEFAERAVVGVQSAAGYEEGRPRG